MKGETKERWMELCAQAAVEQDPQRLMELVREINDLLEAKEQRLRIMPGHGHLDAEGHLDADGNGPPREN